MGKTKIYRKRLCHYLICSIIGLIILLILLTKKILLAIAKLEIWQAFDYQIQGKIELLVILKYKKGLWGRIKLLVILKEKESYKKE